MGLSGVKRRNKISNDPNNTTWSKSTDGFGHKILSAQGWKPGQLLGAENAAHAEHLTAANASHIRVVLREDNLGLGAQLGKSNVDTFGLSTLSSIFGRLNGKSEVEVEKMEKAQRDVQLRTYQSQRWGTMNFVSGGLLVGDKMLDKEEAAKSTGQKEQPVKARMQKMQIEKKRKHIDESEEVKKAKRSKTSKAETTDKDDTSSEDEVEDASESDRPSQKLPRKSADKQHSDQQSKQERREMKVLRKAEKQERKEAKKKRKAEKTGISTSSAVSSGISTPIERPGSSTPQFAGSRHAVRQRYIQQKRLASMDSRALNEILMLKTAVT